MTRLGLFDFLNRPLERVHVLVKVWSHSHDVNARPCGDVADGFRLHPDGYRAGANQIADGQALAYVDKEVMAGVLRGRADDTDAGDTGWEFNSDRAFAGATKGRWLWAGWRGWRRWLRRRATSEGAQQGQSSDGATKRKE